MSRIPSREEAPFRQAQSPERVEGLFADAPAQPPAQRGALVDDATYSFDMPHSPAAMSRRFIAGVTGTAPTDVSQRSSSGSVFGAFFTASGGIRSTLCLVRVVFVVRFEVVDGIVQSYVETHPGQPEFFAQVAASREQILMSSPVSGIEAGKNPVAVARTRHQPNQKGNDLTMDGDELHRDVAMFIEPDDEGMVGHASPGIQRVNHAHPFPSVGDTRIQVWKSDQFQPISRRNGGTAA